jgi:hypothetical protein
VWISFEARRGQRVPPLELIGSERATGAAFGDFEGCVKSWVMRTVGGGRNPSVMTSADLTRSLSASCVRVLAGNPGAPVFVLASRPSAKREDADAALTQVLLWVSSERSLLLGAQPPRVHLLVPEGCGNSAAHRARLLDRSCLEVSVWLYGSENWDCEEPRLAGSPPEPVEDFDFRWPALGQFRWSPLLGRVVELAPGWIRRYPRFKDYDSLRILGLEFARASGPSRNTVVFGVGGTQSELTDSSFAALEELVRAILYFRRADSPDIRHPYYRLQAERWLESEILENASDLFAELEPGAIYSQIPVYLGAEAGRVDVLGMDRNGTLVVIELKVKEDPGLPLQALDYWGRVRDHSRAGDFERRGYFGSHRRSRQPPRVYLVAPVFRFHDSTERLVSFLDRSIEIWKIGINEDWRSGVRILLRRKVRGGGAS